MHKNVGFTKEEKFVKALDGRKGGELSHNLKHMLKEMFGLFDPNSEVKSGLVENFQKPDFYIELDGNRKYVSLKTGRSTGVGEEGLKQFILYLRDYGLSEKSQKTLLYYHFGDGTLDGSGEQRLNYNELRLKLEKRVEILNYELNSNKEFVKEFIRRCLFKGTQEENIESDYICHGDIDYSIVCSKTQIMKHVDRREWDFMDNPHIGPIQFRPHARYIGKKVVLEERRWKVDFWWANLSADLDYIAERYDG